MERNGRRIATRSRALVAKDVGDEVVLYDLETDKVHLLDPRASVVWRLAKEPIALEDLIQEATTQLAADEPWREELLVVVDELASHGLLDDCDGPSLIDRRRMLKLAGAAALAAPAITTILAPPAAANHSPTHCASLGQSCGAGAGGLNCCSSLSCYTVSNTCVSCLTNGQVCSGTGASCCTDNTCQTYNGGATSACCNANGFAGCGSAGTSTTCCSGYCSGTACACVPDNSTTLPRQGDATMCCSSRVRTATEAVYGGTVSRCCAGNGTTKTAGTAAECCTGTVRVNNTGAAATAGHGTGTANLCCIPVARAGSGAGAGADTECCSGQRNASSNCCYPTGTQTTAAQSGGAVTNQANANCCSGTENKASGNNPFICN